MFFLFFYLAVHYLICSSFLARSCDAAFEYQPWALNRSFSVSNEGPFLKVVNSDPAMLSAARGLLAHFDLTGRTMKQLDREASYFETQRQTLCNATSTSACTAVENRFQTMGLGRWTSSCTTDIQVGDKEETWNNIRTLVDKLQTNGMKIVASANVRKTWKQAYQHANFTYEGPLQKCNFYHVVAFRSSAKWGLLLSLTSLNPMRSIDDFKRHYLEEYVQVNSSATTNGADAPLINFRINVNNTEFRRVPTTTTESSWGATPSASLFRARFGMDETPAIKAAIVSSSKWIEVAEDSLSAANTSIMVLSLGLSLVPLAAFADVNHIVTLIYTLATDVIACLPLLIKGIELVQLSDVNHAAIRTRVYGMDSGIPNEKGVAELYVARCSSRNHLYITGVIFIALAICAICVGILLEIYCSYKLNQIKTRYHDKFSSTICTECRCSYSVVDRRSLSSSSGLLERLYTQRSAGRTS